MELGVSTPEWVYVNAQQVRQDRLDGISMAGRRTVKGEVKESHPAGSDLYINHDYNDIDIEVAPSAGFTDLLATGNTSGNLGLEWEAPKIPLWAWPQPGDEITASGSWIWDCGHWGNSAADPTSLSQFLPYDPVETGRDLVTPGGAIRGEQTELHPLYEVALDRVDAAGIIGDNTTGTEISRLDVWISGDGAPALAEEECALMGSPNSIVDRAACSQFRDVSGDYSYLLPLGEQPEADSLPVTEVIVQPETDTALAGTPVSLNFNSSDNTIEVGFSLPHGGVPQHFGVSVVAGWEHAPAAIHHKVTLDSIEMLSTLDGASEANVNPAGNGEQTSSPGDWVLYASVSGRWVQIPGISEVATGDVGVQKILGILFDFWLPSGVTPTLFVSGHECDVPLIDCAAEHFGATAADSHPFRELGFNDSPGRVGRPDESAALSLGQATYEPDTNSSATSTNEDLSDFVCGGPCYRVKATRTDS